MQHDVFICHASEDKDAIVRPLAEALRDEHVDVWYDEFSLDVGDSLREAIDRGLASSRYGVAIISPAFLSKPWPQRELNGLVAREMGERRKLILPVWHQVELGEVLQYSPPLADVRALRSSIGVQRLCQELLYKIRPAESPLVSAREELERFGWDPPPFSDEWWLDTVGLVEQLRSPGWRTPWLFPPPEGHNAKGKARGLNIAWTALQLDWQSEAEHRQICQMTEPNTVLEFVRSNVALSEACEAHPRFLANYAPQLLLPEFSAEFGPPFDKLLAESEAETRKRPDSRYPAATCDKRLALRHPTFGGHVAVDVVDKWIHGLGGDNSAQAHRLTDYLFWLLAVDSDWMPARVRNTLIIGMRDWAAWTNDLTHGDSWNSELTHAIYAARRGPFRWTRGLRESLAESAAQTVRKLGLADDPKRVAEAFIEWDFVSGFDALQKRRLGKTR